MKEGIQLAEVIPFVSHLDFVGTTNDIDTIEQSQILKGHVHLVLTKAVKIKALAVKFKGNSSVKTYDYNSQVATPLYPKLKTRLCAKPTILPPGQHFLPWELEIPNIYPRSFDNQRAKVDYKVQLKISLGGINKSIIHSHDIALRRHMHLLRDLNAVLLTRFENATNQMLRFRVETPKVVCTDQEYIPISIDFIPLNRLLPVKQIYTQIIELTTYRCRNVSKTEADMTIVGLKRNNPIIESFSKHGDIGLCFKTVKRIIPATINNLDLEDQSYYNSSSIPLLVKQDLDISLELDIDSPLVAISHQIELTFNFGGEDEVRAKIPVIVSCVPDPTTSSNSSSKTLTLKKHVIETQAHKLPPSVELADIIPTIKRTDSYRSTFDEGSIITTTSEEENIKPLKKAASDHNISTTRANSERSLFRGVSNGSSSGKRRSITPSPPSSRPASLFSKKVLPVKAIDTDVANNIGQHPQFVYTPTSASVASYNNASFYEDERASGPIKSPVIGGSFMGLHPPPRKNNRKKEQQHPKTVVNDEDNTERLCRRLTSSSSISTASTSTVSRPTSPASMTVTTGAIDHHTMILPAVPTNNSLPLEENDNLLSPTSRRAFLSQSKSSSTSASSLSSSSSSSFFKKRSNSVDQENIYSNYIANHYVDARLPPIPSPPAITRQRLPSVPNSVDEHRKTRMYFEEDSDDDEDYSIFL